MLRRWIRSWDRPHRHDTTHHASRLPRKSSVERSRKGPGANPTDALHTPTSTVDSGHLARACSSALLNDAAEFLASNVAARTRSSGTLSSSLARDPGRERESRTSACVGASARLGCQWGEGRWTYAMAAPVPGPAPKMTARGGLMVAFAVSGREGV